MQRGVILRFSDGHNARAGRIAVVEPVGESQATEVGEQLDSAVEIVAVRGGEEVFLA